MPLVRRKPVGLIPLPLAIENGTVPVDQDVFLLKATGELFLDYDTYSKRMTFYLQKIFTCEYSGRSGLDYFEAIDSEFEESSRTQSKFPDPLKPKVLKACQFQVEGRLETLVDQCFSRFDNRYFLGEKVIVSNPPQGWHNCPATYYGLIVKIEPPPKVRLQTPIVSLVETSKHLNGQDQPGFPRPENSRNVTEDFPNKPLISNHWNHSLEQHDIEALTHVTGTRLELGKQIADDQDPPEEYVYTCRLMENQNFRGSEIEMQAINLSRDRQAWSKNLLKRYLKECLTRDAAVGSPWMVKTKLSDIYNIPTTLPEAMKAKSDQARDVLLTKRRGGKPKRQASEPELEVQPQPSKRVKANAPPVFLNGTNEVVPVFQVEEQKPPSIQSTTLSPMPLPAPPQIPIRAKSIKYPIEDLALDPTSIFDGRLLRSKHSELPSLPKKPLPQRSLLVPHDLFDLFISCWNFLNVFGQALQISPFTLDDFASALEHTTLDPRCILLGEIHSVLTSNIASDGVRITGTTQASVDALPYFAATDRDEDGMTIEERERWATAALDHCRGWDRKARPRASDGRMGWETHLLGILTQRGGLEAMPNLPRILRHLFTADSDEEPNNIKTEEKGNDEIAVKTEGSADPDDVTGKALQTREEKVNPDLESRYLSLSLTDKLDILMFLCDMNLASKVVRNYVEDCDVRLTEERKEKADINRERKELLAEKAALLNPNADVPGQELNGVNGDSLPAIATPQRVATPLMELDDTTPLSVPPSSRDHSLVAEEQPSSRQPSSSPLPDLDSEDLGADEEAEGEDEQPETVEKEDKHDVVSPAPIDELAETTEIGSDVDELESSGDERARRQAAAARPARGKKRKSSPPKEEIKQPVDRKTEIEEELNMNTKKEDLYERDWRRHREVARIRPLGKDRFHQRYWWFDGIGPQSLVASNGRLIYGTGRLFVQGPSEVDWDRACAEFGGEDALKERRKKEEGHEQILGIDEWGFYDEEEDIIDLISWLNIKGFREVAFKASLQKWQHYIVQGAKSRQSDLLHGYESAVAAPRGKTRGGSKASDQSPAKHYLAYENSLAVKPR